MRANSLTNLGVALDYNVASDYDKVLVLSGIASEIEELAPHANEIATLVANLPDVLTVQEASELVNSLTVKVTTLPEGSTATSELVGTEIRLGIPAGTQGVQGIQGPKGDKGDRGDIGLTGAQGPTGSTGSQGPRGFRGEDGLDGEGVIITSILNNLNKSLTINFSDGTQHTTDPLKGEDGRSVTITNVVNNTDGTLLINFSDGTSHTTKDLTGPRGFKGDTGDRVHHISYQRSKDPLGNEVGSTEPGRPGYDDTYAMWASQEELPETFIGEFVTHNGLDTLTASEQAKLDSIEFGATTDQEAFEVPYDNTISGLLSEDVQNSIDELSATKLNLIEKGQPNGVAELDSNGLVPSTQLPSYVDVVLEFPTYADLPIEGETGKIYVVVTDATSNGDTSTYRWTGTVYAMVSNTLNASDVKALYEANPDTNAYTDAEKSKLTSVEDGATADQTADEILTLLKTVDGSGSELDADLLDGQEGAYYLDASNINAGTIDDARLPDTITSSITGNAATATKLATARTINGINFDGTANITVADSTKAPLTGAGASGTWGIAITGNSASATKLATARTIGGVSFDGTANINLPGVNAAGNQSTTGNAATATKLQTAITINGVSFNGSANITVSDDTKLPKTNPVIVGSITEQVYNLTGTAISPENGTIQYKTVSANTTFTETIASGQSVLLRLINASNYTITFPTITWVGVVAPTLTANCAIVLWKEQSTLYGAFAGTLV